MRLSDIPTTVISFVIVGIVLAVSLQILEETEITLTSGIGGGALNNTTGALSQISGWLPTMALATSAALVIGVVVYAFYKFG